MKTRLSSDYLYHFTGKLDTVKLILQNGFRHSLISELRPNSPVEGKKFLQQNYLVCFCDIKPDDNAYHRQCYGSFALAMTKQWGIMNKVSPVQYVHNNSRGSEQTYLQLRSYTKGLFAYEHNFKANPDLKNLIAKNLLSWSLWMDDKNIPQELIEKQIEQSYNEAIEILKRSDKNEVLPKYILTLRQRIADYFEYIESLNPFQRNYKEDFLCPNSGQIIKDKILYDEREWRSCASSFVEEDINIIESEERLIMKGYLSEKHNIRFIDADLIEIRLDNIESKDELYVFLKENTTNLDIELTIDKVKLNE